MSPIKNNFDAVRLLAALFVLYSHQFALQGLSEPLVIPGLSFGTFGVFVFFSVSGFLVSQSWRRSPQALSFMKKRMLRIWPGFAMFTLVQLMLAGPLLTSLPLADYFQSVEFTRYLKNLYFDIQYVLPGLYPHNVLPQVSNGSAWTLPWELKCYLLLVLISLLWAKVAARWKVGILLAALVAGFVVSCKTPYDASSVKIQFVLCFFLGVLFDIGRGQVKLSLRHQVFALYGLVAGLFAIGQTVAAVVLMISLSAITMGQLSTPVLNRVGRFGDMSYGVYLYGFFAQQLFFHWGGASLQFVLGFVTVSAMSLMLAYLSWHGVEKHALKFK